MIFLPSFREDKLFLLLNLKLS